MTSACHTGRVLIFLPFPTAPDDALTAWRFVRGQGGLPGLSRYAAIAPARGADRCAAQQAEGDRRSASRCAWLVSPWTDLSLSGASLLTRDAVDPLIDRAYLDELAAAYVPAGIERMDPRISVLFADLEGLPPTLIRVGSAETLLDDAVRRGRGGDARCFPNARNLAHYDPRLAPLERALGGWATSPHQRR
jgi:epsilon-lactone hydrolase